MEQPRSDRIQQLRALKGLIPKERGLTDLNSKPYLSAGIFNRDKVRALRPGVGLDVCAVMCSASRQRAGQQPACAGTTVDIRLSADAGDYEASAWAWQ